MTGSAFHVRYRTVCDRAYDCQSLLAAADRGRRRPERPDQTRHSVVHEALWVRVSYLLAVTQAHVFVDRPGADLDIDFDLSMTMNGRLFRTAVWFAPDQRG